MIGPNAFLDNETIEVVILADTVEEIGEKAFGNCRKLREVILTTESLLMKIGSKAFLNCEKISRDFAKDVEDVAPDAFEGVPEETDPPVPTAPPAPTEDPEEDDPYDDIEWEDITVITGGGGRGSWQPHAKSRNVMHHDYDQVELTGLEEKDPMEKLILGDEELDIALPGGLFTLEMTVTEKTEEQQEENVLILSAQSPENCIWEINGAGLRKLSRSGVDRLGFRVGKQTVSVSTEGFLAGWKYDELKSRGTAARRFDYMLEMNGSASRWWVTVEGETMELGTDPLSDMYLDGVAEEFATEEKESGLGGIS